MSAENKAHELQVLFEKLGGGRPTEVTGTVSDPNSYKDEPPVDPRLLENTQKTVASVLGEND